jgi:hypothetical protein
VRVHSGSVLPCCHGVTVAVRCSGCRAVIVVVPVESSVWRGMRGGSPMRQTVRDLRQENGDAPD